MESRQELSDHQDTQDIHVNIMQDCTPAEFHIVWNAERHLWSKKKSKKINNKRKRVMIWPSCVQTQYDRYKLFQGFRDESAGAFKDLARALLGAHIPTR